MDKSKWSEIIKINDKEFEKKNKKNVEDGDYEKNIEKIIYNHNLKNIDDEFEKIYNNIIIDIKVDFENYINEQCMPFLDNHLNYKNYNFYDFLKYNSQNYIDITNKVKIENEEILRDNEKDEEEEYIYNEVYELD